MSSPCPEEDDLVAFASGDVSEAQRRTLIGHLADCDECRIVTSELSKQRLGEAATEISDGGSPVRAPGSGESLPGLEPEAGVRSGARVPLVYERPPVLAFAPGEIVAGKYRVVRVLGVGGMGVVIESEHLLLERRVALKFMGPLLASDREAVARFLREARAASAVPSEHVVKVLDVDTLDDGIPYIVMERLYGEDLSSLSAKVGKLDVERAVGYVIEASEALAYAHAKGIVHRDLKPANLFLTKREDGSELVKVLDFGIAKSPVDPGGHGVTTSRTVLGSPRYMAPEQMQSAKSADARADVWALGTILFELVSGRPAFEGETLAALSVAICAGPVPDLGAALPSAPPVLVEVVSRCLARAPHDRYASVADLVLALAPLAPESVAQERARIAAIAGSSPSPARPSGRPSAPSTPPVAIADARVVAVSSEVSVRLPRDSRPGLWIGIGALLVMAFGIGAWAFGLRGTTGSNGTLSPTASSSASMGFSATPSAPSVSPSLVASGGAAEPTSSARVEALKPGTKKPKTTPPPPVSSSSATPLPAKLPGGGPSPSLPASGSLYDERR